MNQERIKNRILRRAARLWGYNELEAESSFDPIVGLLLSACAAELEKLGFEMESSRARIIERVLEIMFPEEVSGVIPARTILQVQPFESNTKISRYSSFKTSVRKQNIYNPTENTIKEIYFSPSIEAITTTARLKYFAYGEMLHHVENFFFDEMIRKADVQLPSGELWLGIQSADKEDLEDLMFFIDINNTYQEEIFFHYLKQVKVFVGTKEYAFLEGYNVGSENFNLDRIITQNHSDLDYMYSEVNHYYHKHFFTLKGKIRFSDRPEKDQLFLTNFPEHKAGNEDDIIWLKFQFSEAIVPEILQNVRFALNCIPALNIRNKSVTRKITGKMNIIPIDEEDHFLDLDYVSEENGQRLDIKNYESGNSEATALLRNGGVSRFDKRNASELLQYLLELIKDETAAFAGMGGNVATEILKQISQNLASLHQVAKEKEFVQTSNPYLIVSSGNPDGDSRCTISYWSTASEEANNLKPATVLTAERNGKNILKETALMIHASVGGRKKLSPQDKILEYRSALLTRGRIVTIADIRAFGMNHFKNTITGIDVKKGTKKEVSLKGGFSRTIDIYVVRNNELIQTIHENEWKYICENFLLKLKNISPNIYPYRLFEK
ncbi:type VI secretion system baseplate subunit TssF [Chryseobacterium taichungense]|uniref:type VI secretion system baseplate subunit TssF n=1 Tax=Chryseobacterium taichungense TaxID=295069 RepID=UPI0028A865EE|nr:type VI secretion system baseplate subunit TssF [Chryseobacterium taichungense]